MKKYERRRFYEGLLFIMDCCSFTEGKAVANPPPRLAAGQAASARPLPDKDAGSFSEKEAASSAVDAMMARDNFDEGLRGGICHV
jgi:hypothetical protein